MRFKFDRSTTTVNRLHQSGADAQIQIRLFDAEDDEEPTISFDAFVSVFWQVLLEGVRAPPDEYDISYELESGVFRVESVDDHLRIEEQRPRSVRAVITTDPRTFVEELVSEAEAFVTFCSNQSVDIEQPTVDMLHQEIKRTREWYRTQYGTDLDRIDDRNAE